MTAFDAGVRASICDEVERTLLSRDKMNTLHSEHDLIVGACAVMRIINIELYGASEESSMDCIPPKWLMFGISGRSIVEEIKKEREVM